MLEITYDFLDDKDVRGTLQAHYLVGIEAYISVIDAGVVVYEEPYFPVVELARSLFIWLEDPDSEDFIFDSMSFGELGVITIRQEPDGWTIGSVFTPEITTAPVERAEIERCCRAFISKVENGLLLLGLNPEEITRR